MHYSYGKTRVAFVVHAFYNEFEAHVNKRIEEIEKEGCFVVDVKLTSFDGSNNCAAIIIYRPLCVDDKESDTHEAEKE